MSEALERIEEKHAPLELNGVNGEEICPECNAWPPCDVVRLQVPEGALAEQGGTTRDHVGSQVVWTFLDLAQRISDLGRDGLPAELDEALRSPTPVRDGEKSRLERAVEALEEEADE